MARDNRLESIVMQIHNDENAVDGMCKSSSSCKAESSSMILEVPSCMFLSHAMLTLQST